MPIGLGLKSLFLAVLLAAKPAVALTPIERAELSSDITFQIDGQTLADEDVASTELATGVVSTVPLGVLPGSSDISAYHALESGGYLIVFDSTVVLPGGVAASPRDVVGTDGTNYAIGFNGRNALIPDGARIDAVALDPAGRLVLSFDTAVTLAGSTYSDEDLVTFDGSSVSSLFDGSAEGLQSSLDVDGAHVFSNGNLALSFATSGTIGGIDFDDEDVLEFHPPTSDWAMAWDSSVENAEWSPGADVNAVHLVPEPSQTLMILVGVCFVFLLRNLGKSGWSETSSDADGNSQDAGAV